ncbi:MAG: dihydrolipoyl dehydrogenase [Bacilli bacterium]|jgi:dihydrolipoamide dehydrogenase|nr:dihydrolipoyl dehydrogenase [Acholeplasmataceae bacterium]
MTDLIIIGAGPGGYELALEASKYNLSSILIEAKSLGGTCLNEGCIPTKAYYKNASFIKELSLAKTLGVSLESYQVDFETIKARKDQVVEDLKKGIEFSLKKAGVQVINGYGKIIDKTHVQVGEEIYEGKYIVIATGSSPIILPGFENAIDSSDLLDLTTPPQKLVIIGGGVIGIEMASIFNYFGSTVEVVEYADRIIPSADKEISRRLLNYLKQQGIKIHLNSKALKFENNQVEVETKGEKILLDADQVMVAVGRKPNLEGLGLDEVGIEYTRKGIVVDEDFKTNVDNIYAIGDATGKLMLAHYATYSGYRVLADILNQERKINFNLVPGCVFTFPEVAYVGLTEDDCKDLNYKVHKGLYRANGKAVASLNTDGFIKIITIDDIIKGVHIIGAEASVLIHEMSSLMNLNITLSQFEDFIHAHPTLSEILTLTVKS